MRYKLTFIIIESTNGCLKVKGIGYDALLLKTFVKE